LVSLTAMEMTARSAATLIAIAVLSGCSVLDEKNNVLAGNIRTNPEACSSQLIGSSWSTHGELDSGDIRLVNWNIQKGDDPQWTTDLATSESDPDLMVLQEVPFNLNAWGAVSANQYRSFSPGYRTSRSLTGVMTVSTAKPLTQCNLVSVEPWIRSPKATVITEYGLTDSHQTLLVVNIHAVNFTFGIHDFQKQIRQALSVLNDHAGPILLSGDFNTWHSRRSEILNELTNRLGLEVIDYDEDHRKLFMGQPLDHIYVRGLEVLEATTHEVGSSDHNPMSVRLRL
jgi:endonuclease/exonuclease/phosphatase (EEP) superfamily protein YafD